ncbi:Histone-lysine N-methyltransferase setd2 [Homalodisca vitripennis]|nr:Histone-lysine N-methyltransferase setd2 [Homalodisca vitripennis]
MLASSKASTVPNWHNLKVVSVMAKRRRGSANGKGKDSKNKDRSLSTETDDKEGEGKSSGDVNLDESSAPKDPGGSEEEVNISNTESDNGNEPSSQENLMPIDIQQMILGDLQTAGGGDEIIVSREPAGDSIEDEMEIVAESPREEEYEVHTEGEEDEELVLTNDEDGEEGHQYVIVLDSDYEVTNHDDASQEISIQNLTELQEGSCEIITVVRESDYESSQESVDGIEEDCDNINAVIGTIDGIHCVKISQYNSDDELSIHEDEVEEDEIRVTEHETEIECFSSVGNDGDEVLVGNSENVDIEMLEAVRPPDIEDSTETKEPNCIEKINNSREIHVLQKECDRNYNTDHEVVTEELTSEPKFNVHENNCELVVETPKVTEIIGEVVIVEDKEIDEEFCVKDDETSLPQVACERLDSKPEESLDLPSSNKDLNVKIVEENCVPDSSESKDNRVTRTLRTRTKSVGLENKSLDLENKELSKKEDISSHIKFEHLENLQEHIISSNSSVSENMSSQVSDVSSQSPKKENSSSLHDFFDIERDNKVEIKGDVLVKEELSLKEESEKQATFRNRSGSTDTTGSESGSNSGSGRRRSGRIKSISSLKQSELDNSRSGGTGSMVTSTTTPPVPGYEADKPVKVKSRWRRSSELEMGSSNRRQLELDVINANLRLQMDSDNTMTPPPRSGQPSTPPYTPPPDREVEDILAKFQHLDCNEYLTDRSKSKDAKRMVCDCTLTKEELARGDMGCGEDCLNRLLMIECGARCMLGERCANKRFQNLEYAKCEVFKTEMKGYGLRALEDISPDTFLLEYVGEVLDPKEFRKRAKEYAKDKNLHFYFMALKSDSIIDATQKGNISRFINHSCDPNAETQKGEKPLNGSVELDHLFLNIVQLPPFFCYSSSYGSTSMACLLSR